MQLRLTHLNVRSLTNHMDLCRDFVIDCDADLFAVSESWLSADIPSENVSIPYYTLFRADRSGRGGGVALYVRKNLSCKVIYAEITDYVEHLWVSTKLGGLTVLFGVVYRPPKSNVLKALEVLDNCMSVVLPQFQHVFVVGDININLEDTNSVAVNHFYDYMDGYDLVQMVESPTRITASTKTLIDFLCTSDKNLVLSCSVLDSLGISDHCAVSAVLNIAKKNVKPKFITSRNFKYFNYESFNNDLKLINWNHIYEIENVDDMLYYFNNNLTWLFDKHAPLRTVRVTKKPSPWLTDTIKLMFKLRDKAYLKYKRSGLETDWVAYKDLRNYVNGAVRREKKAYIEFSLRTKNSKSVWSTLRAAGVIGNDVSILPLNISDPDLINRHFMSVSVPRASEMQLSLLDKYESTPEQSKFTFHVVDTSVIVRCINSIKSMATGSDGISSNMIKLVSGPLLNHITHIVNSCILSSQFPASWKQAKVIPIPKVANPTEISQLRPISILPTLSKVLERVLQEQLAEYVFDNKIIPACQSGFRPDHSTATALVHITDELFRSIDSGKCACLILLDYSKAFDTLKHNILCSKLKYFGVNESSVEIVRSFLNGRSQTVVLGDSVSQPIKVEQGVPQGSLLGPLLFSIYIADFYLSLSDCNIHHYADDTQLWYSFQEQDADLANKVINDDLRRLSDVSLAHGLQLNAAKSTAIILGPKRAREAVKCGFNIEINGVTIEFTRVCKNLGLYIDNELRFVAHVNSLCKSSYLVLKRLYPNRHTMGVELKLMLCNSLILSRLSYCDVVYGPALLATDATRLQQIQNSCVRFTYGIRKYERGVTAALKSSKMLDTKSLHRYHLLCMTHKIILQRKPQYIYCDLRPLHSSDLIRSSRHDHLLRVPRHSTALFQRSFIYNACFEYNALHTHFKDLTLLNFKKRLKECLLL